MPPITLWFLQGSRCIRTAWLLEELGLDYTVKFSERENHKAPPDFKTASGNPLGKFPTLHDGDLIIYESGAINDYLCETYDTTGRLLPSDPKARVKVRQWVHAAEATFAVHALAILYARWTIPKDAPPGTLEAAETGMAANVQNDFRWLEAELEHSPGRFLCGDRPTAADVMMQFSADFILARELGVRGGEWPHVVRWLEECKRTEGYRRAVERTGYKL